MIREIRGPDGAIGRMFGLAASLMLVVVLMGGGRHLYRAAAVSEHREMVRAKTLEFAREADAARREASSATAAAVK